MQLAKRNPARIYLAARTPSKAEAAIDDIKGSVPSAEIVVLKLDLASCSSISDAVREFNASSQRLDILMNNAGVMAVPPGVTKEGYEIQFGTNHVGHALLTKLLLPKLLLTAEESGSDVRIIILTSLGHFLAPLGGILLDKSALDSQNTWTRYGQSKLANVLHARELARRYPSITTVSVHPGLINTDLYNSSKEKIAIIRYGMMAVAPLIFQSPAQGAHNQLWAATIDKEKLSNGGYYNPVAKLSGGSWYARNSKLANDLWNWTEKELEAKGY